VNVGRLQRQAQAGFFDVNVKTFAPYQPRDLAGRLSFETNPQKYKGDLYLADQTQNQKIGVSIEANKVSGGYDKKLNVRANEMEVEVKVTINFFVEIVRARIIFLLPRTSTLRNRMTRAWTSMVPLLSKWRPTSRKTTNGPTVQLRTRLKLAWKLQCRTLKKHHSKSFVVDKVAKIRSNMTSFWANKR